MAAYHGGKASQPKSQSAALQSPTLSSVLALQPLESQGNPVACPARDGSGNVDKKSGITAPDAIPNCFMVIKLLNAGELAFILGLSKSFVYQIVRNGRLPAVRIGRMVRVRPEDLEAFLQGCMDDKKVSWYSREDGKQR